MTCLLDFNVLIAAIWPSHSHHKMAFDWLAGGQIALCPIAQLGFIRISTNPRNAAMPMEQTRQALLKFRTERKAAILSDDLDALASRPRSTDQVADHYLADLAAKHGLKPANFDAEIKHAAVEVIYKT